VRDAPGGTLLRLRVIPRARQTAVAGLRGDALLVRLAAPPVDGAANAALLEFLHITLQVPRRQLTLVSGERGRDKTVRVEGLRPSEVESRLG
jgi:uncharacterized protein (TIGR00251 family)